MHRRRRWRWPALITYSHSIIRHALNTGLASNLASYVPECVIIFDASWGKDSLNAVLVSILLGPALHNIADVVLGS